MGFLLAISFMEAWLKFQAPGVTINIGLSIGKLVFSALNKVEWLMILVIFGNFYVIRQQLFSYRNLTFLIATLMTALETFWGLPALDRMADQIMNGGIDTNPALHVIYVSMEVVKLAALILLGIYLVKHHQRTTNAN